MKQIEYIELKIWYDAGGIKREKPLTYRARVISPSFALVREKSRRSYGDYRSYRGQLVVAHRHTGVLISDINALRITFEQLSELVAAHEGPVWNFKSLEEFNKIPAKTKLKMEELPRLLFRRSRS